MAPSIPGSTKTQATPASVKPVCHVAVATADIEKRAIRREATDQADDAAVAVAEPERSVLDREARGVAVRWIGHGGLLASKPEAVITQFETGRNG